MKSYVACLALLAAAGCGGTAKVAPGQAGNVTLASICPGAHQVYDSLVASNPASQDDFVQHLRDLWTAADAEGRRALSPVIKTAVQLAAAGRGPGFSAAQDAMYRSVVGLDAACRNAGSFILH